MSSLMEHTERAAREHAEAYDYTTLIEETIRYVYRGGWEKDSIPGRNAEAEFDRWLAAHDASRDAEVAAMRERVAELEAVIEKGGEAFDMMHFSCDNPDHREAYRILADALLDVPPSEVLAAVRREAAADELERFARAANQAFVDEQAGIGHARIRVEMLFKRAAELRALAEGTPEVPSPNELGD